MKNILIFILLCIFFFSCKPDRKALLTRTWRANTLDNPQMEDILVNGQKFIDTVGANTGATANMELYGTNNIDSLKIVMQMQLDSVKAMQQNTVHQTIFTFRKDGVAILQFNGSVDSSKWYFDDQGNIVLDEMKENGGGDKIKMEVLNLSDTALKLNFKENETNSAVTFHPDKK
jgi:hypothetical protein